jgi:NADPH2:quinone reductase
MAELALPGAVVAEVPDGVDAALAAALGIAGLAGWVPLAWRAPVRADDRVLVLGATGAVGQVAVQAAKLLGAAHVVAAGRDPDRLERALELGADETVPLDGDFGEPTYVFDPLCGEPLERAVAAAAPRARIVQLGQSAGPTATLPSAAIRGKQLDVLGFSDFGVAPDVMAEHYVRLVGHAAAGEITLELDRVGLDEVAAAWERPGKLVVCP